MKGLFTALLLIILSAFLMALEYGAEVWLGGSWVEGVGALGISPYMGIGAPVGPVSVDVGLDLPLNLAEYGDKGFVFSPSLGIGADLRLWYGDYGLGIGAVYDFDEGMIYSVGLNALIGDFGIKADALIKSGEKMKFGVFFGIGYNVFYFGEGCRTAAWKLFVSDVDGIAERCGGKQLVVSRKALEEAFKNLEISLSGKKVGIEVKKGDLRLKKIALCFNGKKFVFEDGKDLKVLENCEVSEDDLSVIYRGREFTAVLNDDFREMMEYLDLSSALASDTELSLAGEYGIPILILTSPEEELKEVQGCESWKLRGRKLTCGGEKFDVLRIEVPLKISGERFTVFRGKGGGAEASIGVEGLAEAGRAKSSMGKAEIRNGSVIVTLHGMSDADVRKLVDEGLEVLIFPESFDAVEEISERLPKGAKIFYAYNPDDLRIVLKPLPVGVEALESCYYDRSRRMKVRVDLDFTSLDMELPVRSAGESAVKVDYSGKIYTVPGVTVIEDKKLEEALKDISSVPILSGGERRGEKIVEDLDKLTAAGGDIEFIYEKGKYLIRGDGLKRFGEKSLRVEEIVFKGCDVSGKVAKRLEIVVLPNPQNMKVKGVVFRGVKGPSRVRIEDEMGRDIGKYLTFTLSTDRGDLKIDRGMLRAYPSETTLIDGTRKIEVKVSYSGREISDLFDAEFEVLVLPAGIDRESVAFVRDGKSFRRLVLRKNSGKFEVKVPILGSDGKDLTEFLDSGSVVKKLRGGVLTFSFAGVPVIEVGGVSGYKGSGVFVIDSTSGGDFYVNYLGSKVSLSVVRLLDPRVDVRVGRVLTRVEIEPVVPKGVAGCDFSVLGPDGSVLKKIPVSEKTVIHIPIFETVEAFLECEKRSLVIPDDLRKYLSKSVTVEPPSMSFRSIEISGEIEKIPANVANTFPLVSITGKYTAYVKRNLVTKESWLLLRDNSTGKTREIFRGAIAGMEWHPMEDVLVFSGSTGGDYSVYLYDPSTGKLRTLISQKGKNVISPTFDYFGRKLAWVVENEGVKLADFSGGKLRNVVSIDKNGIMPAVSPDGRSVVFEAGKKAYLWRDGKLKVIDDDDFIEVDFSWSPDGKWIVFYKSTNYESMFNLMAYNVETGRTTMIYEGARRVFGRVLWLSDEEFLFGSVGEYEISKFSLSEMREVGGMAFEYPERFLGEVVTTYNYNFFRDDSGRNLVVFGGYLATGERQRETILWGILR